MEEAALNVPEETEEETAQWQLESDLARWARQKKLEDQKRQKEKAKTFSKELNKGAWKLKTAVSVLDTKKKKIEKLPTEVIQSPDEDAEEEEEEPLPEGFCLQRIACIVSTSENLMNSEGTSTKSQSKQKKLEKQKFMTELKPTWTNYRITKNYDIMCEEWYKCRILNTFS